METLRHFITSHSEQSREESLFEKLNRSRYSRVQRQQIGSFLQPFDSILLLLCNRFAGSSFSVLF